LRRLLIIIMAIGWVTCILSTAQTLPKITEKDSKDFAAKRSELYKWQPWQFLLGKWKGDAKGVAGEGSGEFSFRTELDGKILVVTNSQEFGATSEHAAFTYQSMMVVYLLGVDTAAIFYDNEGHVLNYTVQFSDNPKKVTFIGQRVAYAPRFRFSYVDNGDGTLKAVFETAPANTPTVYSSHVEGTVRKVY
jgi:hypothetical protein